MDFFLPKLYSFSNLKKIRDNFLKELTCASTGDKNSLAFIRNPLPTLSLVKNNEIFQVMTIGGTVFDTALVKKQNSQIIILERRKINLPLFENREIFLSFFEKYLSSQVRSVALNFAYALKPLIRKDVLDGKLINVSKEHKFKGLINKLVGREIEDYILSRSGRKIKVTLANDTVCLILSGLTENKWQNLIGGIIGTGTNFSLFLDKNTIVNLESGRFDKFKQTNTGVLVDKNSLEKRKYFFEKEVSGAYLYQHYNLLKSDGEKISSTLELTKLAEKGNQSAQKLLERSASLIACQMAGIYLFKKSSLKFIMEGSLFWDGWQYKKMIEEYLVRLGIQEKNIDFIKIKDSAIIGPAFLVLQIN